MQQANKKRSDYDLCVIGAGAGGFAGAIRATDHGKRVCLVEAGSIGGASVRWGALASKTLWELAKDYAVASKTDRGYHARNIEVNYQAVIETVLAAVAEKQNQMLHQIRSLACDNPDGTGTIDYVEGRASFRNDRTIEIKDRYGNRKLVQADFFLVATGSRPRSLAGFPCDQLRLLNSDGILGLPRFPGRLMIIGAGVTGCEYATIFSNFRQTKVYLVDNQSQILPYEDEDISAFVSRNLEANGVTIYHSAHLHDIDTGKSHLKVALKLGGGRVITQAVDAVLFSVGREPNLEGLDLQAAGIEPDAGGYLNSDDYCRVKGNIYAAGDVTHRPALVNMAVMEARKAVRHMFTGHCSPFNYTNLSSVMFFYPAVAAVGLNEKGCRNKQIPYRAATYSNALLTRAIAMRAGSGFVKIMVSDDERQTILGMRAAGPQVSNTIMSIALLMDQGSGISDVIRSMYPHPTMSEGIQECLRLLQGKSTFKPEAFPDLISFRCWSPSTGFDP